MKSPRWMKQRGRRTSDSSSRSSSRGGCGRRACPGRTSRPDPGVHGSAHRRDGGNLLRSVWLGHRHPVRALVLLHRWLYAAAVAEAAASAVNEPSIHKPHTWPQRLVICIPLAELGYGRFPADLSNIEGFGWFDWKDRVYWHHGGYVHGAHNNL